MVRQVMSMKSFFLSAAYILLPSMLLWWFMQTSDRQSVNHLNSPEVRQRQQYDEQVQHEIDGIWKRIEVQLVALGVEQQVGLNPPASPQEIEDLEDALGFCIPADYKASLLVHNGSKGEFCSFFVLCDTKHTVTNRSHEIFFDTEVGASPGIRAAPPKTDPYYWHPGSIPVAWWDVYLVHIDVESGQVFGWNEDTSSYEASSWKAWLERVATRLESGELTPSPDEGFFWRPGWSPGSEEW